MLLQVPFICFHLFEISVEFHTLPSFENVHIEADKPVMWASSGKIHASSHLLQWCIGCFGLSSASGKHAWSWYPSTKHYTDAPIILLYKINTQEYLKSE